MTSYVPVIKNGASGAIFYLGLPSAAGGGIFQTNPTLAAGDVKVSIDGGALANLGTLPAVTPAAGKGVKVTLSQAEVNGDNITIVFSDQTSPPEWCDVVVNIQTVARQINDLAYPATSGRSLTVSAAGATDANVTLIEGSDATDQIRDSVFNGVVENSKTFVQLVRGMVAAMLGKASGLAGTTAVYRDNADSKDRISATVDTDGNRTAVTLDLS